MSIVGKDRLDDENVEYNHREEGNRASAAILSGQLS